LNSSAKAEGVVVWWCGSSVCVGERPGVRLLFPVTEARDNSPVPTVLVHTCDDVASILEDELRQKAWATGIGPRARRRKVIG